MPAVFGEVVVRVGDHRATGARGGIVVPGPQEYPVRVGAGLHRAVIGVADREGVGQRELERQVAALEARCASGQVCGVPSTRM
ncbi:hypothetical protein G6F24_018339 [Rhizopus arrhizus]|nr:hypothetical protein G6F24_018339 [Rhizopus arrhizus]